MVKAKNLKKFSRKIFKDNVKGSGLTIIFEVIIISSIVFTVNLIV
jgi:hypothetical protein